MEKKKPTNLELTKRLERAIIHLDRTKSTKDVYFDDKALRLVVDEDEGYAIVSTLAHKHVFNIATNSGMSMPFIYINRFIEIASDNDCMVKYKDGTFGKSYYKLYETLKAKEDDFEYNIFLYFDWWLNNIEAPLYEIHNDVKQQFYVYERYMHTLARNEVLRKGHEEDVTTNDYVKMVCDKELEFMKDFKPIVLLKKKTKEELAKEESEAMAQELMDNIPPKVEEDEEESQKGV